MFAKSDPGKFENLRAKILFLYRPTMLESPIERSRRYIKSLAFDADVNGGLGNQIS